MAIELEGLEFQVEAKATKGAEGISKLADSLSRLKTATKGGAGLTSTIKQLDKLNNALSGFHSDKLESLGKALQGLAAAKDAEIPTSVTSGINRLTKSLKNIDWSDVEKLEDMGKALRELKDIGDVKIPKVKTVSVGGGASAAGDTSGGATPVDSGVEQAQAVTESVSSASSAFATFKNILAGVGSGIGKVASAIGKLGLKTLQLGLKGVSAAAKTAANGIGALVKNMGSRLAARVKQTTAGMGQLFSSLKRIAMYRAIRAFFSALTKAMKEGISNLYQYSSLMGGTFKSSMDSLATSFLYLKNSMGAMVAPLLNAIAPAVDYLIGKFVQLLNIVNQFFAKLSGASTFTAAKKVASTYEDAAGTASGAAKELKKSILGFDEINALAKQNDSGGGGGSSNPDYGSMFEELPIDSAIGDFTDRLKEAFENGDWKTLGTLIGNKFNEIVDLIPWEGIGQKIGYYLNGAIQTAYYALKAADFTNLGQKVASMINSALSEIDGEFIGRLIVRWFTAGLDFLIGLVTGLDWGRVGTVVGDAIKGAFSEAQEWIAGIDWGELADTLYQDLKDCLTNMDFSGIAQSFFKLLGSALAAAVSFIGTIAADIWADITGYFSDYLTNDDGTKKCGLDWVAGILEGIWDGIKNIGTWIYENVFEPFIDGFKEAFGIHSPSTVMAEQGGYIIEGLLNGIIDGLKNIGQWIKKHILDPIVKGFEKLGATVQLGVELIKEGWESLKAWVGDKVTVAISLIKRAWTTISAFVGTAVTAGISLAKQGWTTLREWVGEIGSKAFALAKDKWTTISAFVGDIGSKAFSLAKSGWTTISAFVGDIGSKAVSLTKSGWTSLSSFVGSSVSAAVSLYKSGWTSLSGFVGSSVSTAISLYKSGWSSIKSFFGLSSGGTLGANGGLKFFSNALGGSYSASGILSSIPQYAGGTAKAHGTMFVAGERGEEIVGHINGHTEVLNKSQLASTMFSSIVSGMSMFSDYWNSINRTMVSCTNTMIMAMAEFAKADNGTFTVNNTSVSEGQTDWIDSVARRVAAQMYGDDNAGQFSEGIREGMYEANARQNDLLREQNELLRRILEKDTTVEVTTNSFTNAINRKNQRDGKTVIPVSV